MYLQHLKDFLEQAKKGNQAAARQALILYIYHNYSQSSQKEPLSELLKKDMAELSTQLNDINNYWQQYCKQIDQLLISAINEDQQFLLEKNALWREHLESEKQRRNWPDKLVTKLHNSHKINNQSTAPIIVIAYLASQARAETATVDEQIKQQLDDYFKDSKLLSRNFVMSLDHSRKQLGDKQFDTQLAQLKDYGKIFFKDIKNGADIMNLDTKNAYYRYKSLLQGLASNFQEQFSNAITSAYTEASPIEAFISHEHVTITQFAKQIQDQATDQLYHELRKTGKNPDKARQIWENKRRNANEAVNSQPIQNFENALKRFEQEHELRQRINSYEPGKGGTTRDEILEHESTKQLGSMDIDQLQNLDKRIDLIGKILNKQSLITQQNSKTFEQLTQMDVESLQKHHEQQIRSELEGELNTIDELKEAFNSQQDHRQAIEELSKKLPSDINQATIDELKQSKHDLEKALTDKLKKYREAIEHEQQKAKNLLNQLVTPNPTLVEHVCPQYYDPPNLEVVENHSITHKKDQLEEFFKYHEKLQKLNGQINNPSDIFDENNQARAAKEFHSVSPQYDQGLSSKPKNRQQPQQGGKHESFQQQTQQRTKATAPPKNTNLSGINKFFDFIKRIGHKLQAYARKKRINTKLKTIEKDIQKSKKQLQNNDLPNNISEVYQKIKKYKNNNEDLEDLLQTLSDLNQTLRDLNSNISEN